MILYRWNVANTFTCVLCIHSVSPSDIVSKWMGESEKQVPDLFQKARQKAPSISGCMRWCGKCSDSSSHKYSLCFGLGEKKNTILLTYGHGQKRFYDLYIVLGVEANAKLTQAIRRRFDMRIYIPLLDFEARKRIFKRYFSFCKAMHLDNQSNIRINPL